MRIKAFSKNIELQELNNIKLKNCSVVIDGQNYFYNLYEKSGLPYKFGCEADKYAKFLEEHLSMFTQANVTCYVVFKGGHEDITSITKPREKSYNIVQPVFMKKVYKEVLEKLGIHYVVCMFESKQQCVALANKLKCPIISNDIEFCFSGEPYIPLTTLSANKDEGSLDCAIFYYEQFKTNNKLTDEKVAIFIALSDKGIGTFPENIFKGLYQKLGLNLPPFKCNQRMLQWLSRVQLEDAYKTINSCLNTSQQKLFREVVEKILAYICRIETPGIPVDYLLDRNQTNVHEEDPIWFEKGVALGNIDINYVNLYHSNLLFGSWCMEDTDADDAMLLSFDIIAYAYNLMTNYERNKLEFINRNKERESKDVSLSNPGTICKPDYKAKVSPFENGWDQVKDLKLFEHFLIQSLQGLDFTNLHSLPEDAKVLMLALVYLSRRKPDNMIREVYSILLSYVMLGVVLQKVDKPDKDHNFNKKPFIDPITKKNLVTRADSNVANVILQKYFVAHLELDTKLIHPLVEFQHCLEQLNNLNCLCGTPFTPTLYHQTYNGTFVYQMLHSMKDLPVDRVHRYIEELLCPAPTVLAFFSGLITAYEEVMYR